jgi:mono/diheme cytochrome c family protein
MKNPRAHDFIARLRPLPVLVALLMTTTQGLGGCASFSSTDGRTAGPTSATTSLTVVSDKDIPERMRGIAKTHCGTCHQSTLSTAKPAALAIYDLDAPDWAVPLTIARLQGGFTRRLERQLQGSDLQVMRRFVEIEVARRR